VASVGRFGLKLNTGGLVWCWTVAFWFQPKTCSGRVPQALVQRAQRLVVVSAGIDFVNFIIISIIIVIMHHHPSSPIITHHL